jgi:hypothetical protein
MFLLQLGAAIGMTYTMTWSGGPTQAMVVKAQVAGDNARMDFPGMYYLIKRGVQSLTVVDTAKRTYYQMDYGSLQKSLSGIAQIDYSGIAINVQRVSPDSTIDGYATQHWRLTDDHTQTMSMMIVHNTTKSHAVEDFYFAPAFKDDLNPFMKSMGRQSSSSPSAAEYQAKLEAAYTQMYNGVPLLMVMHVTSDKQEMTMTGRISDIKRSSIAASVFAIPAGYQKIDMPTDTLSKVASALNDSLKKAGVNPTTDSNGSPLAGAVKNAGQGVASDAASAAVDKAKQKIHSILHVP